MADSKDFTEAQKKAQNEILKIQAKRLELAAKRNDLKVEGLQIASRAGLDIQGKVACW